MHPPSCCSAMEVTADDAVVSYSSSSTEEYPYPYPYPYQHQHQHRSVTKRKRTVRPRAHSLPISAASSAASAYDETSSTATTEEEDMAHCLILLARGRRSPPPPPPREKPPAGVYECKTCNKCFSSFQALGGHRASHKKPKTAGPLEAHRAQQAISTTNDVVSIGEAAINYTEHGKMKIHECSTCGAEFSSGQALGGHMRRHRTVVAAPPESPELANKGRNFLPLDLNLPPASDEDSMSPVAFTFVERGPLAFSTAPALVDCYY